MSDVSTQDRPNRPNGHRANGVPSPRNRLQGTVLAVKKDMLVAQVEMACGPYRIVSLMSRDAADELDLKPGDDATAIIKSAAVFVEAPDRSPLTAVG
jgi:molybdopterin-binding protein